MRMPSFFARTRRPDNPRTYRGRGSSLVARTASVMPRWASARNFARVSGRNSASSGPALRVLGVEGRRDHVEVAGEHERLLERQALARIRIQAAPSRRACSGTCRCRPDCRWANRWRRHARRRRRRDHRFEKARVLVGIVAGEAAARPRRTAASRGWRRRCRSSARARRRCSRGPRRARAGTRRPRTSVSCRQTTSGCRSFSQRANVLDACLDGIDVPGRDPHRRCVRPRSWCRSRRRRWPSGCRP